MNEVVELLKNKGKTISTMESCTGGAVASKITDVEGSSEVLKFSAVTYSNEFKIKMGVDKSVIDKYSVYSIQTANEMSKKISDFTNSDYAVGITGKINREDEKNKYGENNVVFISIYDRSKNIHYEYKLDVLDISRKENKERIVDFISNELKKIINL